MKSVSTTDKPWFSMQFVKGTTLSMRLAGGPMAAEDAVRLLLPVVGAIDSAHRGGVLHRDLKPSNVLISRAGEPFVTDFGLAKRVATPDDSLVIAGGSDEVNLTQSGAISGHAVVDVAGAGCRANGRHRCNFRRVQSGRCSVRDADGQATISGGIAIRHTADGYGTGSACHSRSQFEG